MIKSVDPGIGNRREVSSYQKSSNIWPLIFVIIFTVNVIEYENVRDFLYFIPLMLFPFVFLRKKIQVTISRKYIINNIILYCGIIIYSIILLSLTSNLNLDSLKQIVFILSPILTVFLLSISTTFSKKVIDICFASTVIVYIIQSIISGALVNFINNLSLSIFISSEAATESQFSFLFGFFVIYYLFQESNKWNLIVSVICTIMAHKRIVYIAILLVVIIGKSISKLNLRINSLKYPNSIAFMMLIINLSYLLFSYNLAIGTYDDLIYDVSGTSMNYFTAGRQYYYNTIFSEYDKYPLFGYGIGYPEYHNKEIGLEKQMHNDILKNYLDFGIIVFCIWILFLYNYSFISNNVLLMTIYLNILFFTDNVFLYFHVILYYYIINLSIIFQENENTH